MKKIKNIRKVSYRSTNKFGQPIASIPIQGAFLGEYGFNVGDTVDVKYGHGFVHISKIINARFGPEPVGVVVR